MGKIFGGSKSKSQQTSSSSNQGYGAISTAFNPLLGQSQVASDKYNAFLNGDRTGFDNYLKNSGYDFERERGEGGIQTALNSGGLRNSGSALKRLLTFNSGLNNTYSDKYMNSLMGQFGQGTSAASAITGAGNISASQGTSTSKAYRGIGEVAGAVASAVASSDIRLKKNIRTIGKLDNGLNVYRYNYVNGAGPYIGVMAHEVKAIQPEALGPVIDGYMTVDYSQIVGL